MMTIKREQKNARENKIANTFIVDREETLGIVAHSEKEERK